MSRKTIVSSLVGAAVLGLSLPAFAAGSATGNFNVAITLTPKCEVFTTGGATTTIADLSLAYTSFQTTDATGSTNFQVRCTNTLGYSLGLDKASDTDGTNKLAYTLALTSSAASPGIAPIQTLSSLTGNGKTGQTYYVHGAIAANQDGTVAATTSNPRTLTISY